jgi:Amt family ammonium transporter
MTWIILWITDRTVGLRVSAGEEVVGLDLSEHGEVGYQQPEVAAGMTSETVAVAPDSAQATEAQ